MNFFEFSEILLISSDYRRVSSASCMYAVVECTRARRIFRMLYRILYITCYLLCIGYYVLYITSNIISPGFLASSFDMVHTILTTDYINHSRCLFLLEK